MKPQLTLVLCFSFLTGCATLSMDETGFLGDYSALAPDPDREVLFIPDEINLYRETSSHEIDSVMIAPIEMRLAENSEATPDEEDIADLKKAFDYYLNDILGEEFEIVEEPGERTAIVRAAITDVDPSNSLVNLIGLILVVPFDMGGISGEIDVSYAATGKRILAMKACRGGSPFLVIECFQRWGHAYHGMMKWSDELLEMMHEQQPE